MLSTPFTVFVCVVLASTQFATAQGGRGRGRAEEVQNRVGAFFADTTGPAADGDKAGELAKADLVLAGAAAGQPTVLYLFDGADDPDVRQTFERALFASDEIGIMLRCFHCGCIDLQKDDALKAKFGKQAPLFVAFDGNGKQSEAVSMAGYKASTKALESQLIKAAQGTIKPSLAAFAKEYGGFVRDFEQLTNKKKAATERLAKAGSDKAKRAEAEKDLDAIGKEEQKLLGRESELLAKVRLPDRPSTARRFGGRGERGPRG